MGKKEFWKPLTDWAQATDASSLFEALALARESEIRALISNVGQRRLSSAEQLNSMQFGPAVESAKKEVETSLRGEMDIAASKFKQQLEEQNQMLRHAKADHAQRMTKQKEDFEKLNQQFSASLQAEVHACASGAGA